MMLPSPFPTPPLGMNVCTGWSRVLRNRCRNAGSLPRTSGSFHSHTQKWGLVLLKSLSLQRQAKTRATRSLKLQLDINSFIS